MQSCYIFHSMKLLNYIALSIITLFVTYFYSAIDMMFFHPRLQQRTEEPRDGLFHALPAATALPDVGIQFPAGKKIFLER